MWYLGNRWYDEEKIQNSGKYAYDMPMYEFIKIGGVEFHFLTELKCNDSSINHLKLAVLFLA